LMPWPRSWPRRRECSDSWCFQGFWLVLLECRIGKRMSIFERFVEVVGSVI
jgi:hypothetical protein